MLFEALPRIVRESLLHVSYAEGELEAIADLAEDQHALRVAIAERELVCFVADGAILPRESGISKRPMADAVAFSSPESMRCTIELPHAGSISGMGVPRGVTLIVGGGYHGKSTLVKAIESGVYDHVAGDGREFVVCDETAVKLRAEDGRSVRGVDISLFINNLPNGADTKSFWTEGCQRLHLPGCVHHRSCRGGLACVHPRRGHLGRQLHGSRRAHAGGHHARGGAHHPRSSSVCATCTSARESPPSSSRALRGRSSPSPIP